MFAFGPFLLFPERQLLLRGETPVRLGCRALDILTALVERPGELVAKAELMARVWPSTVVVEANLKVNMVSLRRALDDVPETSRYIATVPGRGYRFVAPVQQGGQSGHPPHAPSESLRTTNSELTNHASKVLDALGEFLRDRRLLLVIDSCEDLVDSAAAFAGQENHSHHAG